jgi:uncharacterized protein YkuJ
LILTITSTSYSQNSNSIAKHNLQSSPEKHSSSFGEISVINDSGSVRRNEHNKKAIRNFIRDYKNVTDAKWFKSADGFDFAYFTSEDIRNWVYYTKKGNYLGMIRHYKEDKLPLEVRHRVKSTYYDFNISHVTEVTWDNKLAYVINMEDTRSKDKIFYKIIKVVGGEMEVMKEFSKKMNQED